MLLSDVFQASHMCPAELTCWYLYNQHNMILERISKHFHDIISYSSQFLKCRP